MYGSMRHGNGTQTWPDGSKYEGDWKNDKANGKGRYVHANGSVYTGNWKDNQAHGLGVLACKDGSEYRGRWVDDTMHGFGKVASSSQCRKPGAMGLPTKAPIVTARSTAKASTNGRMERNIVGIGLTTL